MSRVSSFPTGTMSRNFSVRPSPRRRCNSIAKSVYNAAVSRLFAKSPITTAHTTQWEPAGGQSRLHPCKPWIVHDIRDPAARLSCGTRHIKDAKARSPTFAGSPSK